MAGLESAIPYLISLGAVVATFYGIRHTNEVNARLQEQRLRSEERSQDRSMLRLKGEELFMLIHTFRSDLGENIGSIASALLGDGKSEAVRVTDIRSSNSASLRIEMLTRVYFPDAAPALDKLKVHHGKILAELLKVATCNTPKQCEEVSLQLVIMVSELTEISYQLQKMIVGGLRELGVRA
jgi:hypothetical protein